MRLPGLLALTIPVVLGPLALVACNAQSDELTIDQAIVRLSPNAGAPSVAYFTVKGGPTADRLIDVSSPVAIRAEMHESMTKDGMATMAPITGGIAIPAKSAVKFEEGGRHLMLFNVNPGIKPNTRMTLLFTFASGTKLEVQASVRRPGQLL